MTLYEYIELLTGVKLLDYQKILIKNFAENQIKNKSS